MTSSQESKLQGSGIRPNLTAQHSHNMSIMPTSTVTSPHSFARFEQLPLKLRLKIWRQAQPDGRIISISCYTERDSQIHKHSSASIHPAVLFVNRESREETLRWYSKFQIPGLCLFFNQHRDIYYHHCTRFQWDVFTWPDELLRRMSGALYFPSAYPPIREAPEEFKIRRLAVANFGVGVLLGQFSRLELDEILILCGSDDVLRGKKPLQTENTRVLRLGRQVEKTAGWGNAAAQNRLLRGLEDQCLEFGDQEQMPIVKLIQVSQVSNPDEIGHSHNRLASRGLKK
jgi:hypothetical protein